MNPINYVEENPRTTGQWAFIFLTIVGSIITYVQTNPDVLPQLYNMLGISAELAGLITFVFGIIAYIFMQLRINYRGNENNENKEIITSLENQITENATNKFIPAEEEQENNPIFTDKKV